MKITKPMTLGLLTRQFEFRRRFWLGVSVIACIQAGEDPLLIPESDMWGMLAEELPEDQPLDAAVPKPVPEFLAAARAFAPGGQPVTGLEASIQFGPVTKTLHVLGDRRFSGEQVSQTTPFTQMPITWARAYGGPGYAENETGKGATPLPGGGAEIFAAPNILDPKHGRAALRLPAGFGPVHQMAPSRLRHAGTHDKTWLEEDFPGFARDMDWRFFNMAPPDQFLPGALTGFETYAFKNLHPEKPVVRGTLPGLAARLFVVRKAQPEGFEEVPLALGTIWCFPHRERLVLIHQGRVALAEEDGADISRIVIGADAPGAHRPPAHFRAVMARRADPENGGIHALRDADLAPAAWLGSDDAPGDDSPEEESPVALVAARQRQTMDAAYAENVAKAVAKGADPAKIPPLAPAAPYKKPALADLPALAAQARAQAEAEKAKAEAMVAEKKAEAGARMAKAGMTPEQIAASLDVKPKGPPAFSAAAQTAKIAKKLDAIRANENTPEDKKARLDIEAELAALDLAEQRLRHGYKLAAHRQSPADAAAPERAAHIRRLVQGDDAAARALYDLHGADLAGLDLSGLDLSGVCLDGANLSGANLTNAKLAGAVLAHANLRGCCLGGADLRGASLGRADLTEARLRGAVLTKAVLAFAILSHADFSGADLQGADLSDATVDGANFSGVHAPELIAMNLSWRDVRAPGILLERAKFLHCDLSGADFSGGFFEKAVFLDCKLATASFAKAHLPAAVFVEHCDLTLVNLIGADLREVNFREVNLTGAVLAGAHLSKADLSGARMARAILANARADDSRFVATDLRGADLRNGSFARVDFARADLRGADLRDASLYEANMPRVRLDTATRRGGNLQTRLRYLPRYRQAELAPP